MTRFHLLSTRRNSDGSFDTPSIDEVILAQDASSAVRAAKRFPVERFDADSHVAWLVDDDGTVLWSDDMARSDAA